MHSNWVEDMEPLHMISRYLIQPIFVAITGIAVVSFLARSEMTD